MIEGTREVLGLLQGRWSVDVLYLLAGGTRRYNQIFYEVGEISKKTLTQTLRVLERNGLVARRVHGERAAPRRVLADAARLEPELAADVDVRVVGRRRRHSAAWPPGPGRVGRSLPWHGRQPEAVHRLARISAPRLRWHLLRTMNDYFRELDHRSNDRIDVRLLWRPSDDRVIVTVADGKTGDRFTVDVPEGESALDVFRHPFAYAAWLGSDARGVQLSRPDQQEAGSPR